MNLLRRIVMPQRPDIPPAPHPLTDQERAELAEAKSRIESKWQTFDAIVGGRGTYELTQLTRLARRR